MKKITLTFLILLFATLGWAQLVTTNPQFVTQDGGAVEITFDATLGSGGLNNFTGDVYAHIGVLTNLSTGPTDWKYAVTPWPNQTNQSLANTAKNKLTPLGGNKYKLTLSPSVRAFFGVPASETIQKIAVVFRNADGTKEGKTSTGGDIFIDVFAAGLNVAFTNPSSDQSISLNTNMNIAIGSSVAANINLLINGNSVKTTTSATTLTHAYTFSQAIDYTLIAEATASGVTVKDTVYICVPAPVVNEVRPAGVKTGINYIDNSTVTLVLHAPLKNNVFVLGEFNDWIQRNAYQMKKDGEFWWITLNGLTPGKMYGFQYLVDGTIKVSDPYAELILDPWNDKWINEKSQIYPNLKSYPLGKTDGLVAVLQTAKPAYSWEVANFEMPAHENMVIYELLLRDFTAEKSLEAAIQRLDYLKNLGITAVELMPVQEFDGNNSWGYNPNHFFAPDKAYGSPETYKRFIDECHKRGIAVILDIVPNHATGSSPLAKMWWNSSTNQTASNNPYFNVTATHPYSVFHDFNHEYEHTRAHFRRVIEHWLNEYKVDGFRLDLTKGLSQRQVTESNASSYDLSRINILTDYYNAAKAAKPNVMFILEHFCDNSEETELANRGMYLWRNVNNAYSQAAMGYQSESDFGGMNTSLRRWVGFAESHDEERNFYKAKMYGNGTLKTDSIARINRVPLNIAFTTLLPGPKMIWQFGELGYDYSIDSNGGRTNEKPSAWSYLDLAHRKAAYDASAKIITLRKMYPQAFTQGTFSTQIGLNDWTAGRRIALTHSDLNMVVLGNFQDANSITASPAFQKTGVWYNVLTGAELNVTSTAMTIPMLPGELLIFTDRKITFPNGIDNPTVSKDVKIYPTVTNGKIYISSSTAVKGVRLVNLQGSLVKSAGNTSELDITNAASGLYVLEVSTLQGKSTHKVVRE
jgi:glycosidase